MGIKPVPAQNVGPGRILRRELEAIGWSNADLAEVLGMSGKSVSQLLNDKQAITVPTARLLAQAFSSSPEFWMNLDQNFRLRLAPHDPKEDETALRAKIRARMPLAEMRKKGWIDYDASATSQVKAYRKFWDKDADDFSAFERPDLPFCARQGKQADRQTRDYSITWFQKARSEASRIKAKRFYRERTLALASSLPDYTIESDGPRRFLTAKPMVSSSHSRASLQDLPRRSQLLGRKQSGHRLHRALRPRGQLLVDGRPRARPCTSPH